MHQWKLTLDTATDRVLFERTSRAITDLPVRIPHASTKPRSVPLRVAPPAPQPIDPLALALAAREYQDAELKAGREISTTQAVAHVLGKRG